MIGILIPQYKEDEQIIKNLLDSIALQQKIKFKTIEVIIINDGSDVILKKSFLKKYPFEIKYILQEHKGVSYTRQHALDESKADYVMFCDADDMFVDLLALFKINQKLANNYDVINCSFVEEAFDKNAKETTLITMNPNMIQIHGKVFKRKYLVENNIRWNEKLTIHEDSYFMTLALSCTQNICTIEKPYYLWKWREDSVCRKDPLYLLKTYGMFIQSCDCLVQELIERDKIEVASYCINCLYYNLYATINTPIFLEEKNKYYVDSLIIMFAKTYSKYKKIASFIEKPAIAQIIMTEKQKNISQGIEYETIPFALWKERIDKLCNDLNKN